jgi:hypothetical protein
MFQKSFTLFLILVFFIQKCLNNLLGVIQLNRHGARTGRHFSNLTSNLFFGSGDEQLTINGYKQVEKLGQWIADRYIYHDYKLLSREFNQEEILIKTSPKARTIFSAAGFMKGLYPFSDIYPVFLAHCRYEEKCNYLKEDDVPPIINYSSKKKLPNIKLAVADPDEDILFHADGCRFDSNKEKSEDLGNYLIRKDIYNITFEEIKEAIDEIKSKWETPFIGLPDDIIYTKKYLNYLFGFIAHVEYHYENRYFNLSIKTFNLMKKIKIEEWYSYRLVENWAFKLINSPTYDTLLYHLDLFEKGKEGANGKLKFLLLSGHDTNIVNILATVIKKERLMDMLMNVEKFYDFLQPPYASSFIIEIHTQLSEDEMHFLNAKNSYFIRILYNGDTLREELHEELIYNHSKDGIDYNSFRKFLESKIDPTYKYLNCQRK